MERVNRSTMAITLGALLIIWGFTGITAAADTGVPTTLSADINGDGTIERVSKEGGDLVITRDGETLWFRSAIGNIEALEDVDGNGILDIVLSTDESSIVYDGYTGALIQAVGAFAPELASSVYPGNYGAMWWFDYTGKDVCWRADLASPHGTSGCFVIDLDGDLTTAAITEKLWHEDWGGDCADLGILKHFPGQGLTWFGWAFRIGVGRIDGPSAHIHRGVGWDPLVTTEWFYYYVKDTVPPTDWIVFLKRSNGADPLDVTDPFHFSGNYGVGQMNWRLFDPSATGALDGHVLDDQTNQPIAKAKVRVKRGGVVRGMAITDECGYFSIWPLEAPATYNVRCNAEGYTRQKERVGVDVGVGGPSPTGHVIFRLAPEPQGGF